MDRSIIVVGTDGVGKTPISQKLAEHFKLPYFKFANEVEALKGATHPGQHMLWFDYGLTQVMEQTGYRMVCDRGYPCELVYSRYFGRQTNDELLDEIDRRHAELGTIILWLYDSKIETSVKDDPFVEKKDIPWLQIAYKSFIRTTRCETVSYDVATSALCTTDDERSTIDLPNVIELIERKVR